MEHRTGFVEHVLPVAQLMLVGSCRTKRGLKSGCTVMNDYNSPAGPAEIPPELPIPEVQSHAPAQPGFFKRVLAYNPFYLTSAALLLFGLYRISIDPAFLSREIAQLCFNLSSLELYEALLVVTAIVLAARKICYDCNLLVALENLFVLVPFILISQAALIDQHIVMLAALAGGGLVLARTAALQRWIGHIEYPKRLLGPGAVVLLMNIALPIVYRVLHESKFGTKPDWGGAYETNRWMWLMAVPVLCALFEATPLRSKDADPESFAAKHVWQGLFCLWLAGTIVHLYCLGYIYDFTLRLEFVAPGVWVVSWMACRRLSTLRGEIRLPWLDAAFAMPALVTLLALPQPSKAVFVVLSTLNTCVFGWLFLSRRLSSKFALHLSVLSLLAAFAGLPERLFPVMHGNSGQMRIVGGLLALYFLVWICLSRRPKLGLLGGGMVALMTGLLLGQDPQMPHWAASAGLAFFLLHSLRWNDATEPGAAAVRWLAAICWVGHAVIWAQSGGGFWMLFGVAGPVLGVALLAKILNASFGTWIVSGAALLVLLCAPGNSAVSQAHDAPLGLIAIVGSFGLFALGTLSALTKHRWHKL